MSVNGDKPLLEVESLVVRYPVGRGLAGSLARQPKRSVHAVEGVTLTVAGGELLALVGESGCGKTTTAQAVLRLVEPVSGSIRFEGRELTGLGTRQLRPLRRQMQLVYQDPYESLDPRLRVQATVEEPLLIHGLGASKEERVELVRAALENAGLVPPELFLDRYPHELSGGQLQRVAVARALIPGPALLVADEPVSMIDASLRMTVVNLFKSLRDELGVSIIYITHDLATAYYVSDRVMIMRRSRVVEEGDARTVLSQPQHPYSILLKSAVLSPEDAGEPTPPVGTARDSPTNAASNVR